MIENVKRFATASRVRLAMNSFIFVNENWFKNIARGSWSVGQQLTREFYTYDN